MILHFLIHDAAEMPGAILEWADNNHFVTTFTHLYRNEKLPGQDSFDNLVIMGGHL